MSGCLSYIHRQPVTNKKAKPMLLTGNHHFSPEYERNIGIHYMYIHVYIKNISLYFFQNLIDNRNNVFAKGNDWSF